MIPLALLCLQAAAAQLPSPSTNPHTTGPDIENGQKLYGSRCAGCHGPDGDGGKATDLATPVLPRASTDAALYRVIRYGLPDSEMPAHNMTPREIWQISAFVRQLARGTDTDSRGDVRRGESLALGKGGCLQCHLLNGAGGQSGPALTGIGERRSRAYLREKLVNPGRNIVTGFAIVTLATRTGERVTGIRVNEDTWSIQVRDAKLRTHSFWKRDLAELSIERRTTMPSYSQVFTADELTDIVTFLASTGAHK